MHNLFGAGARVYGKNYAATVAAICRATTRPGRTEEGATSIRQVGCGIGSVVTALKGVDDLAFQQAMGGRDGETQQQTFLASGLEFWTCDEGQEISFPDP